MEDNPAPRARPLIHGRTYMDNFRKKRQNQTYLCYEVEVWQDDAWTPMEQYQGILSNLGRFRDPNNQTNAHAELCLLDQVPSWHLHRGMRYRLTWYISWSPCSDCALELVEFLRENRHVSLRIFAAHIRIHGCNHGLRDLRDAGPQLAIMTRDEHQHCWDTFVDNQGQPFQSWPNMEQYIADECDTLENILWIYPKEPVHAEICFLNWFKAQPAFLAQRLAPEEKYQVTWFMSWSPCFQCARQVAAFLRDHTTVQLSILAARLYYPRRPQYQQGLHSLQGAGAHVAVMTPADFAFCWEMFVDDHKKRFRHWKGIYINSCSLAKSLEDILRNPEN